MKKVECLNDIITNLYAVNHFDKIAIIEIDGVKHEIVMTAARFNELIKRINKN